MSANGATIDRMMAEVQAFYVAGAVAYVKDIVRIATEGEGSAPAAAIATGELRASARVTVGALSTEESQKGGGFRNVSPQDVARSIQLAGFRLGDTLYARWIAAHANIIEGGRRRGARGMLGSEQNPDGFLHLAIDEATLRMDSWQYPGGSPLPGPQLVVSAGGAE